MMTSSTIMRKVMIMVMLMSFLSPALTAVTRADEKTFKLGHIYDASIPMAAASDRIKHRYADEPYGIKINASAWDNYLITYLEVHAYTAAGGVASMQLLSGSPGTQNVVFELDATDTEYLAYTYVAYGLTSSDYQTAINNSPQSGCTVLLS